MAESISVLVSLDGLSLGRANLAVNELKDILRRNAVEQGVADLVTYEVLKEDKETQDFGATLLLILGTPAALAIATGLHNYISKSGNTVVLRTRGGTVKARGDAAKNIDIAETVKALQQR
jgi:hypothetical protein